MKNIVLLFLILPWIGHTQSLQYSPSRKLDKTVAKNYYDTEFIFIKNNSENTLPLTYDVIDSDLISDWSITACTNVNCFNNIPKTASLGTIKPNEQAFLSINLSANEAVGSGFVRFLITSKANTELNDTITFNYTVTEDGTIKAGPWANVNYAQGILTVLLDNPNLTAKMLISNLDGKIIFDSKLDPITSFPMRDYPNGMYIISIEDENERVIRKRIVRL